MNITLDQQSSNELVNLCNKEMGHMIFIVT